MPSIPLWIFACSLSVLAAMNRMIQSVSTLYTAHTALLCLLQARPDRSLSARIVQYGVVGAPELVLFPVVGHIQLASPGPFGPCASCSALLIGLRLNIGVHAPVFQVPVVLHSVVAAVGAHPLVVKSQAQLLHCRHECVLVGAVAAVVRADDVARVDDVLYVVARLELPVAHVAFILIKVASRAFRAWALVSTGWGVFCRAKTSSNHMGIPCPYFIPNLS